MILYSTRTVVATIFKLLMTAAGMKTH
ncbi:TPA: DUF2474 family protein [Providencia rettgeri]|nr:DUF2474 family protein [Proteus mirabilis]HEC8328899.1 DUF2474 family protein [Providencia rettgeri]